MQGYFGNTVMINGELVKTGPTPIALRECGFRDADEVRYVAAKFSEGTPTMRMDDVAEWFKTH